MISTIGFNPKVQILNLITSSKENIIGFVLANVITLYDVKIEKWKNLIGHEKEIIGINCDCTGRFLLSYDLNLIIIWDRYIENR